MEVICLLPCDAGLARLRQFEQEFHVRTSSTVDALDFLVFRFDDVVLVGSVRAASVAEAKVSRDRKSTRLNSSHT